MLTEYTESETDSNVHFPSCCIPMVAARKRLSTLFPPRPCETNGVLIEPPMLLMCMSRHGFERRAVLPLACRATTTGLRHALFALWIRQSPAQVTDIMRGRMAPVDSDDHGQDSRLHHTAAGHVLPTPTFSSDRLGTRAGSEFRLLTPSSENAPRTRESKSEKEHDQWHQSRNFVLKVSISSYRSTFNWKPG